MTAQQQLLLLISMSLVLIAAGAVILLRVVSNPDRREKRRRLEVNRTGRLGDATITEVAGDLIQYTYSISGVQYEASQDIRTLRELLPPDMERLIGHAHIKYSTRNPANSILVCEEWSGIRPRRAA
jgi:hypothetical protein